MQRICLIAALAAAWLFAAGAAAPQAAQIGKEQELMFDAAAKVMKRDFKDAEDIYDQVIAIDGGNIDAYLQRGIARRELGDSAGTAADGRKAVALVNAALAARPNDPNLYYKRSMGLRLVKNYDQAEKDLVTGMRLGGSPNWKTDLQAIEFEKREGQQ